MKKNVVNIVTTSLKTPVQHKMISAANMKMMGLQTQMVSVICSQLILSKKLNTVIVQDALRKRLVVLLAKMTKKKNGVVMLGLLNLIEITIETHSINVQKQILIKIWTDLQ